MNISSLQISGSALTAERTRLDVISQNIANVHTTRAADGRAYRRRQVIFEMIPGEPGTPGPTGGVRVSQVKTSVGSCKITRQNCWATPRRPRRGFRCS